MAGDVLSVKDFGAVCDGTTDDTTALNRGLATVGRTVYAPVRPVCDLAKTGATMVLGDLGRRRQLAGARGAARCDEDTLPLGDGTSVLRDF